MEEKFYVYFHVNPKTRVVFYVGKGHGRRAWKKCDRNSFWKSYVNKYGYEVLIVNSNLTEQQVFDLEILYIKSIGRRNTKTGSLVNLDNGGTGTVGHVVSEKSRLATSLRFKGRCGDKHPMYGRKASEETRKLMSKASLNCYKEKRRRNVLCKDVLDINTGVFYTTAKEIGELYGIGYSELIGKMVLRVPNNTPFVFCDDYEKGDYEYKNKQLKAYREKSNKRGAKNRNGNGSILLNNQNGVFYDKIQLAADSIGVKYYWLMDRLRGKCINKTYITYV